MWTEERRRIYRREGDGYPSDPAEYGVGTAGAASRRVGNTHILWPMLRDARFRRIRMRRLAPQHEVFVAGRISVIPLSSEDSRLSPGALGMVGRTGPHSGLGRDYEA